MPLRAVSPPAWSLADLMGSRARFRLLRATLLEMLLLSTVIERGEAPTSAALGAAGHNTGCVRIASIHFPVGRALANQHCPKLHSIVSGFHMLGVGVGWGVRLHQNHLVELSKE